MSRKIIATAGFAILLGLSACNTVRGAGEDLKSAGDAISGEKGK
ncbi:entericidin A/B family lipoprotein [Sphingomonas floccifaciens]|uniref:Entericidin A/B family lipoprotein n=1 Tax=Sphingomonas floccifaciens TaxID=1844115 RepID=A0ABW4NIZ4_9SPHN